MLASLSTLVDSAFYNAPGYFLVALGILVSIRFAGFPDLTVDGSFTLGAALYAFGIKCGLSVPMSLAFCTVGGIVAGELTAAVNSLLGIGRVISGVLTMICILTIVPYLVGGTTIGLLGRSYALSSVAQVDQRATQRLFPHAAFSLHLLFI